MSQRARIRRQIAARTSIASRSDTGHEARNRIAAAVYNAIKECPEDALLVPELYGPVSVAASMAWESIARKNGLPLTEETADEIMGYLIDGFTLMAYEFDVQHFEAHKAIRANAERLRAAALARQPEVEAELARRRAMGE